MTTTSLLAGLAGRKVTPTRIFTEHALERLGRELPQRSGQRHLLVAGGGRAARGSESALLRGLAEDQAACTFVDISLNRSPDVAADLSRFWPFKDRSVDFVISTWVLEHIATPQIFIGEAFRVLKQGGVLVCVVPFLYRKHGSPDDYTRFTDSGLSHLAHTVGFSQIDVRPIGGGPFLACIGLLWPLIFVPVAGLLLVLVAWALDTLVDRLSRTKEMSRSYPLAYVVVAKR